MALPIFFEENISGPTRFNISEESAKHITLVLRIREGENILLTNGKGKLVTARILSINKKKTEAEIIKEETIPYPHPKVAIAISLIKNSTRFEWFVEKATEIGVSTIYPLICKRTEKTHFRTERIRSVMISAMLQSRQVWLPELSEPQKLIDLVHNYNYDQKYIAHCIEEEKKDLKEIKPNNSLSKIILIGPEGDFTEEEIKSSIQHNYVQVSLGDTRLRTETAGVVAAVLLK